MSVINIPKASETVAEINALIERLDNPDHRRMLGVAQLGVQVLLKELVHLGVLGRPARAGERQRDEQQGQCER